MISLRILAMLFFVFIVLILVLADFLGYLDRLREKLFHQSWSTKMDKGEIKNESG